VVLNIKYMLDAGGVHDAVVQLFPKLMYYISAKLRVPALSRALLFCDLLNQQSSLNAPAPTIADAAR
jgi:hypothetical protein